MRTRTSLLVALLAACTPDTGIKIYNSTPAAVILSHADGDVVDAGVSIELLGTVGDDNDDTDTLQATWYDGSAELCAAAAPAADGKTACVVTLDEGEHSVVLEVKDPDGASGTARATLTATAPEVINTAPICSINAPEDGARAQPGETVEVAGVATDGETASPELSVLWSSDLDGVLDSTAADDAGNIGFSTSALSVGAHQLSLIVSDPEGDRCEDAVTVYVGDVPAVEIVLPEDGERFGEGEQIAFEAVVSSGSTAAEDLALVWESDVDGELDTSAADSDGVAGFLASWLSPGAHTITLTAEDDAGLVGRDIISLVINGQPSAPAVSIAPDPASPADDLVASVDVESVDPEGAAVSYAYAWTVDGVDAGISDATVPASATENGETWTVTVTPNDGEIDGYAGTATVTVGNSAPVLSDVTLSPDPAYEGDTLTCTPGAATDVEGDSISYSYAWTVNGGSIAATSSTLTSSSFDKGDDVRCVVTPTDGTTVGAAVTSNTVTIENTAPVVSAVAISPTNPSVGDTLTCGYTFSDADGDSDSSTVSWTIDGASAGTGPTLPTSFAGGDTIVCTVTPYDGDDTGSAASASVTIGNTAPTLASVSLTPTTAYEGDTMTCTPGTATDADGDTVSYSYAWTVGGVGLASTSSSLSSTYFDKDDAVICTVTPTDGKSTGTPVASNTVTISNTAPSVSAVSISPSSPTVSSTLTCSWTFADADGDSDASTVAWKVIGSTVGTGTTLSGAFGGGDSVVCTVTPYDGDDTGTAASKTVSIGNTAPTLASVSLTPLTAYEGDTLSCTPGTASDADGDTVSYTYGWVVNGSSIARTSSSLSSTYFSRGDTVYCRVTPTDGTDSGSAVSSNTVTISNSAPELASVSLTPTTAYEGDTLSCTPATGTDEDGDTVSYTYAWTVNGSSIGRTSSSLSSTYFDKDDAVICVVTPTDGTASGSAVNSNTVTVSNTAPSVSGVSISPSSPTVSSTLTCSWTFSDGDGDSDASTVVWKVNGTSVGTGTSLAPGSFGGGDSVSCTVTPYDGDDTGTAASKTISIGNTAPTLASVSLTPTTAYEGDTLSCTPGTATDVDGDTVTYTTAWIVNGASIGRTSSSLSSSYFDKDDAVYCSVTPTDGTTSGTAVSSNTVTISNSLPEVSGVSISPSSPTASSTLTCSWTFSDEDGDSDASTVVWKVNGTSVGTGASLASGSFGGGDSVSCTVTPYDGDDTGTAVSKTVSVSNTAPSLASVSLTPTTAYEGDTMTCTPGTATDVDGDTVTYTYAWTVTGATVGVTSATLSSTYFGKGDAVRCTVTPTDGTTSGSAVASNTVTISNSTPTISGVSLSPSAPTTSSTLSVSYSTADADSDTVSVTYVWKVNGTTVSTSSTLSGTTYFSKDDVVQVSVTPTDGSATGTAGTASVTIGNTAPGTPEIAIDPELADAGDEELLCYVVTDATDADGDTLSYNVSWEVDGLAYPSAVSGAAGPDTTEWTDDTVPAADTLLGETWTCTVTADDGDDVGAEVTATATALDFYEAGYYSGPGTSGSAAPTYMLGPSITISADTTVYKLGALISTVGSSARMALYTSSGGAPANLVAYTDIFTTTSGANEIDVVTPTAITAGTYWVMAVYGSTTYIYYGAATSTTIKYKSYSSALVPSSTFGSASSYSGYPLAYYVVVAD